MTTLATDDWDGVGSRWTSQSSERAVRTSFTTHRRSTSLSVYSPRRKCSTGMRIKGNVWARFRNETAFRWYHVDYWKTHSRFLRRAGEGACCLIVRDRQDLTRSHVLGNNFPLGDGRCLGTTIQLTDNLPHTAAPTREQWFRILNDMFWVFPENRVNLGFVERLRVVTPGGVLYRVRLSTSALPDLELDARLRLSAINGGGSNGGFARGTATYKPIEKWSGWPPKEIGLLGGVPADRCASLELRGGLSVDEV
jgi:hypothetical protein